MMDADLIFLDIETILDPANPPPIPEPAFNLCNRKECKIRGPCEHNPKGIKAKKQPALPKPFHPIRSRTFAKKAIGGDNVVMIGLGLRDESHHMEISQFFGSNEVEILQSFGEMLEAKEHIAAKLISYNGDHFDIPFILSRMMVHGIAYKPFIERFRRQRAMDLFYPVNKYKSVWSLPSASLDSICHFFGIGGKPHIEPYGFVDGSMVAEMVRRKDWAALKKYNLNDLNMTAALYDALAALGLIDGGSG